MIPIAKEEKKQGADGRLWTNNLTKMYGKNARADIWVIVACQQILKSIKKSTHDNTHFDTAIVRKRYFPSLNVFWRKRWMRTFT